MNALTAILEPNGTFSRNDPGRRPFYSITKTFIAAAIVKLGIDPERPVKDWFSRDWLPQDKDIRVRHLLTHTSGLRDYGALPDYAQAIEAGDPVWPDRTFAEHTLHRPLLFKPGEQFAYSNPGYWLLKRILELETATDFATAIQSLILKPLSLEQTSVVDGPFADDLPGYPAGWVWHGLLVGSAGDAARFMASELVNPLRALTVPVPGQPTPWQHPHYGLGLMIEPGQHFGHNGGGPGYSAACYQFNASGRTIAVLRQDGPEEGDRDEAMHDLLQLEAPSTDIPRPQP